jgi:hypothetical protein
MMLFDDLRCKEVTSGYSVNQSEVDNFVREINKNWNYGYY